MISGYASSGNRLGEQQNAHEKHCALMLTIALPPTANATMYDVKQAWRAARNYALNVSEIEAKVDEATNDDPWGASTSLMAEIAQATHSYADFGEIMQAIYRRFMEKEASEWRQIYKVRGNESP